MRGCDTSNSKQRLRLSRYRSACSRPHLSTVYSAISIRSSLASFDSRYRANCLWPSSKLGATPNSLSQFGDYVALCDTALLAGNESGTQRFQFGSVFLLIPLQSTEACPKDFTSIGILPAFNPGVHEAVHLRSEVDIASRHRSSSLSTLSRLATVGNSRKWPSLKKQNPQGLKPFHSWTG